MKITGEGNRTVSTIFQWVKRHGHHLFFGLSLVSLALLLIWWTVFIRRAILQEYEIHRANLDFRSKAYASMLGYHHIEPLKPGTFLDDQRFEIVKHNRKTAPMESRIIPAHPDYVIRPRLTHLEEIEDRMNSRIFMVVGEGSLLSFLLLVSCVMLYRLIAVERRSVRELQEFWGRTTHEIKTPIAGLKTFLQTLKTHRFSQEELKPLVDLALEQVERQQQLAQNLLIGQRLGKETIGLALRDVNLPGFVRKYFQGHSLNLMDKKVNLNIGCDDDLIVRADLDALHVIMDNLIDNAIKYGGDDLRLEIEVGAAGGIAYITVADNGPGIDPAVIDNIFEAYRRLTDELPDGEHGSGMGLFISQKLARKMGGDLEAISEGRGCGSRFRLSLRTIS